MYMTSIQIYKPSGSNKGLTNGTKYTISSDSTTGKPKLTYTDSSTQNLLYNMSNLIVEQILI